MQPPQSPRAKLASDLAVAPFAVVALLGGAGIVTTALPKKRRALTDFPSDAGNEKE